MTEYQYANLGSEVTLNCEVKGYPLPTITWHKTNGNLPQLVVVFVSKQKNTYSS